MLRRCSFVVVALSPWIFIVNGGRVLLRGEVRTRGDRQIAEATLRTLPGVLGVVNELRVAATR